MKNLLLIVVLLLGMNTFGQGGVTNISGESSLGACDASVTAVFLADREYVSFFDQSFNLMRRDTLQWNWGGPGPWELFLSWDNLCTGVYYMVAQDTLGFISDTTVIDLSALNTINIYTQSAGETSPGLCDGSAIFNIQGGVPPYQVVTYNADSSYFVVDSLSFTALCDDIYTVHVIDSDGNSASQVFNVIEGTFSFTNPVIMDSIFADSLSANAIQACNINFADVDSIFIQTFDITPGEDSLIIYWAVATDSAVETIVQVYYLDTNITTGNLLISLDIYCLTTKSSGQQLRALDLINIGTLGVQQHANNDIEIKLYPNPTHSFLFIDAEVGTYHIQIQNMSGQNVLEIKDRFIQGKEKIDLSGIPKGVYFMNFLSSEGRTSKKIILE